MCKEYIDPIISQIDNEYTEEDKKREIEEEINCVNDFWKDNLEV